MRAFSQNAPQEDIPAALDFDRRDSESYRFELAPFGGDIFRNQLGYSYTAGGNFKWNLTQELGLSTSLAYSDNEYLIDGGFCLTVPAAYRTKKGVRELDFFTTIGGGILRVQGANHPAGYIGGGMKIRLPVQWLALRFEVRSYFSSINNPSGSDFENELTIRVGPTFFIPPVFP